MDLFGQPADYDAINALARQHNLFVLEDAAQSFGATYKGKKACSLADVAATSFFPAKPLGGYGDGGAIFTDDDELGGILRSIRVHGQGSDRYDNIRIGLNGRLDTLQAAIILVKMDIFDQEIEARQTVAGAIAPAWENWWKCPMWRPTAPRSGRNIRYLVISVTFCRKDLRQPASPLRSTIRYRYTYRGLLSI